MIGQSSSPLRLVRLLCAALLCAVLVVALPSPVSSSADVLTVHLVPHSHDDVGWQITVDEYYDREVRNIITTVVQALSENPARRFMYVEQAFFQRWWREQGDEKRALAQRLVKSGQLEFVNGGWCMHDEAGTHYVDMVDQTTLGHRYITQQFGVQPTVGWQIDPFGHSATQATLFGPLSGMDGVFFERIDYQDKDIRDKAKTLEMVWRSSPSLREAAQLFAGAFAPGFGYQPPSGFCRPTHTTHPLHSSSLLPLHHVPLLTSPPHCRCCRCVCQVGIAGVAMRP
jgi:alpha-mannosidase